MIKILSAQSFTRGNCGNSLCYPYPVLRVIFNFLTFLAVSKKEAAVRPQLYNYSGVQLGVKKY